MGQELGGSLEDSATADDDAEAHGPSSNSGVSHADRPLRESSLTCPVEPEFLVKRNTMIRRRRS